MHPALEQLLVGSRDPDRKVGAIIINPKNRVVGRGVNNFAFKCGETRERWARPAKYRWVVHAEERAIHDCYQGYGMPIGLTMHTNYFPCARCANHIALAGIRHVVAPLPDLSHERWGEEWTVATQIFQEYGIGYEAPADQAVSRAARTG